MPKLFFKDGNIRIVFGYKHEIMERYCWFFSSLSLFSNIEPLAKDDYFNEIPEP